MSGQNLKRQFFFSGFEFTFEICQLENCLDMDFSSHTTFENTSKSCRSYLIKCIFIGKKNIIEYVIINFSLHSRIFCSSMSK